jgi:hypothetical protein
LLFTCPSTKILIQPIQSLLLLLIAACLEEKQQIPILYSLVDFFALQSEPCLNLLIIKLHQRPLLLKLTMIELYYGSVLGENNVGIVSFNLFGVWWLSKGIVNFVDMISFLININQWLKRSNVNHFSHSRGIIVAFVCYNVLVMH